MFAQNDYDLILVSRSKPDTSDKAFNNTKVTIIQSDLSKQGAAEKLYKSIQNKNLGVDVLINNAGFGDYGFFVESDLEKLRAMMQLNMTTLTELMWLYARDMKSQGSGKILNVGSVSSFLPGPYMATYYATKNYVLALSEAVSKELAGSGVSVTALCPGPTESRFQSGADMEESRLVAGKSLPGAAEVAEYGYRSLMQGKPVAVHGFRNKLVTFLPRILPRNFVTRIVYKSSAPK